LNISKAMFYPRLHHVQRFCFVVVVLVLVHLGDKISANFVQFHHASPAVA
jgi:hypothetical protein